jgi:hypothetical protein
VPLPQFNDFGDLPPGFHQATLDEVVGRFSGGTARRDACTQRLIHVVDLPRRTGQLQRLIVFGSYITAKLEPNDVDIILVMRDSFRLQECPTESAGLFDHALAQARYGASIFWIRPALLIAEALEDFVGYWQVKRDGEKRGIVEIGL